MSAVFQSDQLSEEESRYQLREVITELMIEQGRLRSSLERCAYKRKAYKLHLKQLNRAHRLAKLELDAARNERDYILAQVQAFVTVPADEA